MSDVRSIIWNDAGGYKTITRVDSLAGMGAAFAALRALSNAVPQVYWEGTQVGVSGAPVAAVYQSTTDRAALVFQCVDLTLTSVLVPAPSAGIFMADGSTVDSANVLVAAFITAAIGNLCNQAGSAVTTYISGYRLPGSKSPL